MATTLKFVQFFQSLGGYGWSEIHYRESSSDTPDLLAQLNAFFGNVCLQRAQLLGEDCRTIGARVSYRRAGAVASKNYRILSPGLAGKRGAAPSASIAVNFSDTTNTKSKVVHLRGFWDDVEDNEYYDPNADGWQDRFDIWKAALISGQYGWLSKNPSLSAKGVVTTYTSSDENIITFTLAGDGMPAATVGTQQQVSFSKINRSNSVLNKSILVNVVTRTQLTSVAAIAAGPQISSGRFNFRGTSFVPYASTNSISLGRRQMGKSLFLSRARSRVKPLT